MADFLTSLWLSIFTPGPTPTLVLATNISFCALQLTLFALLIATYSIHFFVLSVLSAGLWIAINWFVKELSIAAEAESKRDLDLVGKEEDERQQDEAGLERTEREGLLNEVVQTQVQAQAQTQGGLRERGAAKSSSDLSASGSTDGEWDRIEKDIG